MGELNEPVYIFMIAFRGFSLHTIHRLEAGYSANLAKKKAIKGLTPIIAF